MKTRLWHGLLLILLGCVFFISPARVHAGLDYGLPTLSGMPRVPDIRADEGGSVRFPPFEMIVSPNTFDYDIYFQNGCWDKSFPKRIGRYWQLSDICEFWPKPHFKANTAPAVSNQSWIITYHYTDAELQIIGGLFFPEESLKIVFSDDHGESWTMLRSSVVDAENNTVSAITDKHGGYMIMAGFVSPNTYYNYKAVKGAYTNRNHEDKSFIVNALEHFAMLIGYVL